MSVRHARRGKPKDPLEYTRYDFELLEVGLLRDMLRLQFDEDRDVERLVDDFVCLCMLVGNDFLPNVPHLEIADGSLDLMMSTYKELRPALGGFVSRKEAIHLPRLELVFRSLAAFEPQYFARRGLQEQNEAYQSRDYADAYYAAKFGIAPGDAGRGAASSATTSWASTGACATTTGAAGAGTGSTRTSTRRSPRTWSTWRTSRSSSPRRPRGRCPRSSNSCPCCRRSPPGSCRNPTPR